MSSEVALLTIVIAVAGGLIAFLGDRLGQYLGKRRATILGIRPRYTAAIISSITGILIAILAVGVVLAVSQDVRDALLKFGRVQADLQQAQAARQEAIRARDRAEDDLKHVRAELQQAEQDLDDTKAARDQAVAAREQAQAEAQHSRQAAEGLRRTVQGLELRRRTLEGDLGRLSRGIDLVGEWTSPRGEVIISADGELARVRIPQASSRQAIVAAISQVLDAAEREATALGAKPMPEDPEQHCIWLAPLEGYGVPKMQPKQLEDALVRSLQQRNNDTLLFVVAALPGKRNLPILADFLIADIKMVYSQGDIVAEVPVTPVGATPQQRLDSVVDAIRELLAKAHYNAIEHGMIVPPGGRFGTFEFSKVLEIAQQVLDAGRPVKLQMVATADVWSDGALADAVAIRVVTADALP